MGSTSLLLVTVLCAFASIAFGFRLETGFRADNRIFGGAAAKRGQFPYQVSVHRVTPNGSGSTVRIVCGGSIISEHFVITGGNCVNPESPKRFKVVVGAHYKHDGVSYDIDSIFRHPEYNLEKNLHDIALMKTDRPIKFSPVVQPIVLSTEYIDSDVVGITSGFGLTNDKISSLKFAQMKTISNAKCSEVYVFPKVPIHDGNLCAYSGLNGTGVCTGDAGGPLTADGKLIGLTSFQFYECAVGYPDVFTRVSQYVEWIRAVMS